MKNCILILFILTTAWIPGITGVDHNKKNAEFYPVSGNPTQASISKQIKVDQFGYLPLMQKIAIISDPQTGYNAAIDFTPGTNYNVCTSKNGDIVFSAPIQSWDSGNTHDQSGDKVWWFDFSDLSQEGDYFIYDPTNHVRSVDFSIGTSIYQEAMNQALKTFYYQRCGTAKTTPHAHNNWTDTPCHVNTSQDLDCRLVTSPQPSNSKDLSGGWHDAGDYNKYVNFTFSTLHDLISAYEENPSVWGDDTGIPESGNGIPDLLDEIKWELDWLLKMQQSDGSSLMKVSVDGWQASSPPSSDGTSRYYGEAQSSATRVVSSIFAHASIAFEGHDPSFSSNLISKAELAWNWLNANPGYSNYQNTGFSSANPEISEYQQDAVSFTAATYLYAKTGDSDYRDFIDDHYDDMHPIQWYYWYPFESTIQDALLYYCNIPGATTAVVNSIKNNCEVAVSSNNTELLQAFLNDTDAYRAYLKNDNYTWGSNEVKSHTAIIFSNMLTYLFDTGNSNHYAKAVAAYLHFLHGVNPTGYCMLSNMIDFGAEQSCQEIYHSWFSDGTDFDNATNSLYGPAPGFITGGCNKNYAPDPVYGGTIEPPQNQPVQKAYKDWNTSWPENSWELSEPAIYNQAAYIKLLSKFIINHIDPLKLNFYVATDGDDNNPGTLKQPWRTIQKACNTALAGSTVYIRQGSYHENLVMNVSGTSGLPIQFTNYDDEIVIIDGSNTPGLTLLEINGKDHIIIEGLHFTNAIGLDAQGILIHGASVGISIIENIISNIHFSNDPYEPANPTKNSQPLIVYGDHPSIAVTKLTIESNEIYNCRTGYSEGLAINGNVDDFKVSKNLVHDLSNIGIDFIGHEGTCSNAALDQARNGVCSENICYNCISPYATAAGIYVDGGKDLLIERNKVYQNQWGIEVGCENAGKTTSNIIVRNNMVYNNQAAGIVIGGYDYPGGSGKVVDCEIVNNTCFKNDSEHDYNGELTMTYTENCSVFNNIFYATSQNVLVVLDAGPLNLDMNYNLYYCPGGSSSMEVAWNGTDLTGFINYQNGSGQDLFSQFIDPSFVNPVLPNPDLYLLLNSGALDSGDPGSSTNLTGKLDYKQHPRIANGIVDQGAIECFKLWITPSSADWNTASNWYPNGIPNLHSDVLVKSKAAYYPVISDNATYEIRSILFENESNMEIGGSSHFKIEP